MGANCHNILQNHTMFCGTDNIMWNILHIKPDARVLCRIMSVQHNIVLDLNNNLMLVFSSPSYCIDHILHFDVCVALANL